MSAVKKNKIGIDFISFYIPQFFLKTKSFAIDLGDSNLIQKTGQYENACIDEEEDIVTMGISASLNIFNDLDEEYINTIDYLIFATESAFDLSKSAGLFCKDILKLKKNCNTFEIKQACYSGTAALIFAMNYINSFPDKRVLIITSDISKYQEVGAQITQGAAAAAFIISKDPKIIEFDNNFVSFSQNVFDFYKPIASVYPIVNGHLSIEVYCSFFQETFKSFFENDIKNEILQIKDASVNRNIEKNFIIVPHLPFVNIFSFLRRTKDKLLKVLINNFQNIQIQSTFLYQEDIIKYTSCIGNSYGACIYINLCSLLENCEDDLSGKAVQMFSFGSGATGSCFQGTVVSGYKDYIKKTIHQSLFDRRVEISLQDFKNSENQTLRYIKDGFQNRALKKNYQYKIIDSF